uniref:Uncharacterized protein n=1 Tax=Hemiselmis andersenii TaxID=464988 RepID=A0A6U2AST3_HEMAN|mmetsp:Transcript_13363/g.30958  ORF Transcript_13363/g.30958 Transcript_13363/m.30958 type:complete len:191 (+) Transcript_13363:101-673(+)|eukprot:CAMPEP_0114143344 /NCGR_PEP_ID=MMETSP0043_2-20121206/18937_1 /TAXON_ID=464988 /ORGANISM="Hemiselmis andersenii, Strain CCMP644" /LENGTH=190 /DNA_ID=CAMNT_0001237637 /DNA_START=52 /DNA_END=624 /DNA_ORIENTATION=-
MAGKWVKTENRGFYYGPSTNNAWNNDCGWKHAIVRETRLAARFQDGIDAKDQPETKSELGSILSSASRDSLYRHFDKLEKAEQIAVLRDALSKRDRLEHLDKMSDRFDDKELAGLSVREKAQRLIVALNQERQTRQTKEQMFVDLIKEERAARVAAESAMKALESKIDHLASAVGVQPKRDFMKRTNHKV